LEGRDFPHPSRPALGPTQPPTQWVPGCSWGIKWQGRGVDHLPAPNAEVKERVELYLYSPCGHSWPFLWWTLLYLYPILTKMSLRSTSCHWRYNELFIPVHPNLGSPQ